MLPDISASSVTTQTCDLSQTGHSRLSDILTCDKPCQINGFSLCKLLSLALRLSATSARGLGVDPLQRICDLIMPASANEIETSLYARHIAKWSWSLAELANKITCLCVTFVFAPGRTLLFFCTENTPPSIFIYFFSRHPAALPATRIFLRQALWARPCLVTSQDSPAFSL